MLLHRGIKYREQRYATTALDFSISRCADRQPFRLVRTLTAWVSSASIRRFSTCIGCCRTLGCTGCRLGRHIYATDGTQTWLEPVIIRTEITTVLIALLLIILYISDVPIAGQLINVVILSSISLVIVASIATQYSRREDSRSRNDVQLTVRLLLVAVVLVPLAILSASLFGLTGA